jgi:hypothetical protein
MSSGIHHAVAASSNGNIKEEDALRVHAEIFSAGQDG